MTREQSLLKEASDYISRVRDHLEEEFGSEWVSSVDRECGEMDYWIELLKAASEAGASAREREGDGRG